MPRPVLRTPEQPALTARLNTSRRRRGLADLVAEAEHRQAAEATAATGTGAR